jgi:propionyl-CoA carboxylase alpha chain
MLYIGAGLGFPPEIQRHADSPIVPHKGHAMEARIYAEDPLRGFLPSTGPLHTYSEPSQRANTPQQYFRIDSGVQEGHIVTPFYDPMLSKAIYYGQTRAEAIAGLSQALDEYVIQGVAHNTRLVQSVLRNAEFVRGNTPTSFLPEQYPDGFVGVQLSAKETLEMAVAAAVLYALKTSLLDAPPLAATTDQTRVVVKLGGLFGDAFHVSMSANAAEITPLGNSGSGDDGGNTKTTIRLDSRVPPVYEHERHLAHMTMDGRTRTLQLFPFAPTGEYELQMYGCNKTVLVQSEREHELSTHIHKPIVADMGAYIQSPMPGMLMSLAVSEGDSVLPGQELCIVEAMKMQNIIRSHRNGVIGKLRKKVGETLKADEIILEFVEESKAADDVRR